MQLSASAASETGPRASNEDAHFHDVELGLFVAADGMGGHNAGEVASRLAVEAVVEFVQTTHQRSDVTWPFPYDPTRSTLLNRMDAALRLANRRVLEAGGREASLSGMATTIVALLIEQDQLVVGHVGDSRAYRLRAGQLVLKTEDHTWVNAVIGAENPAAAGHPFRHVLTSGIGLGADLVPTLQEDRVSAGDRWLLCTDGVHGALDHEALHRSLRNAAGDAAAATIVRLAVAAGSPDNATAVVVLSA